MSCDYSINIGGKKYTLLTNIEEGSIDSLEKLEAFLRNRPAKELADLRDAMRSIDSLEDLALENINENSVGLYSPAELIGTINNREVEKLLNKLPMNIYLQKKVVVPGFANESIPTKFHAGHIFLNLNYMFDRDNKIVALTELALYNVDPNSYEKNSEVLRADATSEEAGFVLDKLTGRLDDITANKLKNLIKLAYQKVNLKLVNDIGESNIATTRESLVPLWNRIEELRSPKNREQNYFPKAMVSVQNLKQGDLVLVPVDTKNDESKYNIGYYEAFYDSYVDVDGKTILRTIHQNPDGTIETRKRVAKIYYKNPKGVYDIKESNRVEARILDEEGFSGYKYNDDTEYIDLDFSKGRLYYDSLTLLLKNSQIKVWKGDTSHEIKSMRGNTITLGDKSDMLVTKVDKISYPISDIPVLGKWKEEDIKSEKSLWTEYSAATIGEHIAFRMNKDDKKLTEAIVIGRGNIADKSVIFYVTKDTKNRKIEGEGTQPVESVKIGWVTEKNVLYVSTPPIEFHLSLDEQIEATNTLKAVFLEEDLTKVNIPAVIASNKRGRFRNSRYSIQELNRYAAIAPRDLLYDKQTGMLLKVVHSGEDFIKTTRLAGNNQVYINVSKNNISNYLLLTKTPINESFAYLNIRKNRYNFYGNKPESNYTEETIWQNPNGFVFSLPTNYIGEHMLKEPGARIITDKMIKELTERYNWPKGVTKLYTITGQSIDGKRGNKYKDTMNTNRVPVDNAFFKYMLGIPDFIQNYILPGSFVSFKNDDNAKVFVVEKIYKDSLLLAYYHYTDNKNVRIKDPEIQYVKHEKFLLTPETLNTLELGSIYIPRWATASSDAIAELKAEFIGRSKLPEIPGTAKKSKHGALSPADSPEVMASIINTITSKYGVSVNTIHDSDLAEFNDPELYESAAFVTASTLYINLDKADIGDPLHEVLHLVLATMKARDPDTYYKLVESVQYHPMFKEVNSAYKEINSELLEETFIKLLTKTFRKNILKEGVFTEDAFNAAMRQSITDMLEIINDLNWEDPFNLLGMSVANILTDFGSRLISNEESLIGENEVIGMFDTASKIRALLKNGNLKQKCHY